MMAPWVIDEMKDVALGDKRLNDPAPGRSSRNWRHAPRPASRPPAADTPR